MDPSNSLKQLTSSNVTDLCGCLSNLCDDQHTDDRDLKLRLLTTCHHWFSSKLKDDPTLDSTVGKLVNSVVRF